MISNLNVIINNACFIVLEKSEKLAQLQIDEYCKTNAVLYLKKCLRLI
jgi:hypothetical protein